MTGREEFKAAHRKLTRMILIFNSILGASILMGVGAIWLESGKLGGSAAIIGACSGIAALLSAVARAELR